MLLPGKSHGRRSPVGCSPWGCWGSDTTERLHFHFHFHIGEGNGNPLQCSCLENPRDGGAWWAAVYGVAQSRTRLKRLSSSSSSRTCKVNMWIPVIWNEKYCSMLVNQWKENKSRSIFFKVCFILYITAWFISRNSFIKVTSAFSRSRFVFRLQ